MGRDAGGGETPPEKEVSQGLSIADGPFLSHGTDVATTTLEPPATTGVYARSGAPDASMATRGCGAVTVRRAGHVARRMGILLPHPHSLALDPQMPCIKSLQCPRLETPMDDKCPITVGEAFSINEDGFITLPYWVFNEPSIWTPEQYRAVVQSLMTSIGGEAQ